jgi:nickel/cobalt exporter
LKRSIVAIFFLIIFLSASHVTAATGENPFVSKQKEKKIEKKLYYPALVQSFILKIGSLQRKLNRKMTELGRQLKSGRNVGPLFILIIISFFYGLIHSLGPGHGKTVAFSYFLAEQKSINKGIFFGSMIAFLQVISASTVVVSLYFIVSKSLMTSFEYSSRVIKLISSVVIIGLGILLVIRTVIRRRKRVQHQEETGRVLANGHLFPVAVAVGCVPCPGAVILLLFSIHMEILNIGVVLALFMALGMAVTISTVGVITISTKKWILKTALNNNRAHSLIHSGMKTFGSFCIIVIGIFLFMGNFF